MQPLLHKSNPVGFVTGSSPICWSSVALDRYYIYPNQLVCVVCTLISMVLPRGLEPHIRHRSLALPLSLPGI